MRKEDIIRYFNLLDLYYSNNKTNFNNEELDFINKVNSLINKDEKLNKLFSNLKNTFPSNREKLIDSYFLNKDKDKSNIELISDSYGIDITNIEHKLLDSGKEIFYFYDISLGKHIILENSSNNSLVEILKKEQENNDNYKGNDNEKNTNSILKDKRLNENIELNMLPINEINNYLITVKGLSADDYKKLSFLLKHSNEFNIDYINLENMIGLTSEGKIYEVKKDKYENCNISEPKSLKYNEENIDTHDRIENEESLDNSYEDIPYEKEEYDFESLDYDTREKTIIFYENQHLLNELTDEEKKVILKNIEIYKRYLNELEKKKTNNKKLVLKKDNKGYANILTLSLTFVIIICIITFCLVLNYLK